MLLFLKVAHDAAQVSAAHEALAVDEDGVSLRLDHLMSAISTHHHCQTRKSVACKKYTDRFWKARFSDGKCTVESLHTRPREPLHVLLSSRILF
jgi:hypothetical protein